MAETACSPSISIKPGEKQFYQLQCISTNQSLNDDSCIVSVMGLPSYMSTIHEISDNQWYGQFGEIRFINVDTKNNCVNIKYSVTESATNARLWTNSVEVNSIISLKTKGNPSLKSNESKLSNESKNCTKDEHDEQHVQLKRLEIEFENREKQFEQQIKQFQYQIAQFAATKQQSEHNTYSLNVINTNLHEQIKNMCEEHSTECDLLTERLKKLDAKYTHVFKQLVARITEMDNANITINRNVCQPDKLFSIWSETPQTNYDRLQQKMNEKYQQCQRLKYELRETYDDLRNMNEYVIELESKLELNCLSDFEYNYRSWDILDAYRWIITINNGRFSQYKKDLIAQLRKYMIYGIRLEELTENDLINIGILCPNDREFLLSRIEVLIQTYRLENVNDDQLVRSI